MESAAQASDVSNAEAGPSRPRDVPHVAAIDLTEVESPPRATELASPSLSDLLDDRLPALDVSTLVPLGPVIDRTAKAQYETLKELVKETLPSLPPRERPKHIIAYAQTSRSALLKVLALLRWKKQADVWRYERPRASGSSGSISLSANQVPSATRPQDHESSELVGPVTEALRLTSWADDQHEHIIRLREHLRAVLDQVTNLRLGDPDLDTALDVLGSGSYTRLPRVVTRPYEAEHFDDPAEVLKTIEEMNRGLQYRLAVAELLPDGLQVSEIRDGKAYLCAEGLFRCTITTTTTDIRNPWYLVDVDFESTQGKKGKVQSLPDAVREQIIQAVEPLLIYTPLSEVDGERNVVLFKLYEILESLALSYQIESLYLQAVDLVKNGWQDRIRVEIQPDRKGIRVDYWSPTDRPASAKAEDYAGSVTARICRVAPAASELFLADELQLGQLRTRQEIRFAWRSKEAWLGLDCSAGADLRDDGRLRARDDLESILTGLMKRHADVLARSFQDFIVARIATGVDAVFAREDVRLSDAESGVAVLVRIYGSRWLSIRVNPSTGRVDIKEAEIVVGSKLEARLVGGAKYANMHPDKLMDVLTGLRTTFIMEATEEKLSSLKCRVSRQAPGTPEDHERIGLFANGRGTRQMKPVLAVALPGSREHVMLLVLEGRTLQAGVARISARPNGNAIQKFIERVTWLDRETCALASAPMLGLDSSTEDLRANLALCSALAIMENLASQLLQRGIICDGMASVSPPALHIRDRDVFKHGAGAGVVLRLLDWQDPARTRMEATYRLPAHLSRLADIQADYSSTAANKLVVRRKGDLIKVISAQTATFARDLMEHCGTVDSSVMLAQQILREQATHAPFSLSSFGPSRICLEYDKSPFVRLEYQSDKGMFAVHLDRQSCPSAKWLVPLVEEQSAAAFNEAWVKRSPLLAVLKNVPRLLPVLDAVDAASGDGEIRIMDLHQWMIIWTLNDERFALLVRYQEREHMFIIQDAASSATIGPSLAIDGLLAAPETPAVFRSLASNGNGSILDAGAVLLIPETQAVASVPNALRQFEQALHSDRKPMTNGTS